jgi:hypothetical protein
MKKSIKILILIPSIVAATIPVLIITLLLLLSVFFPNELVRRELETRGTEALGSKLTIGSLEFSVFKGLVLEEVRLAQRDSGWKNESLLSVGAVRLKYRLLPLVGGTVSVDECVIENGSVNLERGRRKNNWSHLLTSLAKESEEESGTEETEQGKKEDNEGFSRSAFPVDLAIGKVGLDGITVNYRDTRVLAAPVEVSLSNLKLIGKGISLKRDKPVTVKLSADASLDAGDTLSMGTSGEIKGELLLFAPGGDAISLNGPLDFKTDGGQFSSDRIADLTVSMFEQVLAELLGPGIQQAVSDPTLLAERADNYFNNMMETSDQTIKEKLGAAEQLLDQKKEIIDLKKRELDDFTSTVSGSLDEIDSKITEIDTKIGPVLKTASQIPFVEQFANLDKYRKQMNSIRANAKKERDKLVKTANSQYEAMMQKRIDDAFPKSIPGYSSIQKKFKGTVNGYKKNLAGTLGRMQPVELAGQLLPDMSFMEKELSFQTLQTTFILGKKPEARELLWKTDYFDLDGEVTLDGKRVDGAMDIATDLGDLGLNFIPHKRIIIPVTVTGSIPRLNLSVVSMPDLDMSGKDPAEMATVIVDSILENSYSDEKIVGSLLQGVPTSAVDSKELSRLFEKDRNKAFDKFVKSRGQSASGIQKETTELLNSIKSTIPGL